MSTAVKKKISTNTISIWIVSRETRCFFFFILFADLAAAVHSSDPVLSTPLFSLCVVAYVHQTTTSKKSENNETNNIASIQ